MKRTTTFMSAFAAVVFTLPALSQDTAADAGTLSKSKADQVQGKRPYSPYADRNFPSRPFFGDTHLHTGFSMDAGAFGCTLTPRDAPDARVAYPVRGQEARALRSIPSRRPARNATTPA